MKEDWLNDIHDQMVDYEIDEPSNLWEDIRSAKEQIATKRKHNHIKHIVWLWSKRGLSTAAILTLVFSVYTYWNFRESTVSKQSIAENNPNTSIIKENSHIYSDGYALKAEITDINTRKQPGKVNLSTKGNIVLDKNSFTKSASEIKDSISSDEKEENYVSKKQKTIQKNFSKYTKNDINTSLFTQHRNWGNRVGKYAFSVFTTGGISSSFSNKYIGNTYALREGAEESEWKDNPVLGILYYNQNKEVETTTKHHIPIRTGLLFSYKLNKRVNIESGITYTNLTSDLKEGSKNYYFSGKQTLHYLGIPLTLSYRIFSFRNLEVYASSGILLEKCISGTLKKEYILENQVKKEETEAINVKPLQWSLNLSPGIHYFITPSISIYSEPGIHYYFKSSNSIKTIYTDKPLNFNLNIGLRFTL